MSTVVQYSVNMATISSIFLSLFFLYTSLSYVASENCTMFETYYYVANKISGKVLADGDRTGDVNLYDYDPSIYESYFNTFRFYPSPRTGLFTFHIKSYMGALGVNRTTNTLFMDEDNDSIYQQWFFNADGTIVNGGLFNYGLKVNRTEFGQNDVVYLGSMDAVSVDDLFEFIVSPWQVGS